MKNLTGTNLVPEQNLNENLNEAVYTFETKGVNQAVNRTEKVYTDDNYNENNKLSKSVKWIKTSEGVNRLGITKMTFSKHIKAGHFVTRKIKMNGGWGYEISVESIFSYYETLGDFEKCEKILKILNPNFSMEQSGENSSLIFDDYILDEKTIAKYQLCKNLDEHLKLSKKKINTIEKFLISYNKGNYAELKNILGEVSFKSLYRWYKILKKNNWNIISLKPNYKFSNCKTITNKEAEILIPLMLNPNKPLVSEILKEAKKIFVEKNIKIKSDVTYRRFIEEWKSKNIDLWTLGRFGMKAFNDNILKDILRDKDRIEVGDILVADGHTMNVMVINPLTGRPSRITLILFYDFKSDMPLGYEIMPTENTLTIASALRRSIILLGKFFDAEGFIPKIVYLDNGRAFKAKYFNGTKDFRQSILPGLFAKLKIETMFAQPYHGQSKTIERWFRTLGEMERHLPSYTGTNIDDKPAMMLRNEKLHQRLFDNTAITIETLEENLKIFIQKYAEEKHQDGQYKGLSPIEIFMNSINKIKSEGKYLDRLITKKELIYLMMSDETRTIQKNGIRFLGNYYYNEEMMRVIGSKVTIKYDLWDDKEIIVLDNKQKFLFIASKDEMRYHPAARILGNEEDVKMLNEALQEKERRKKEVVNVFKDIVAIDNATNVKLIENKKDKIVVRKKKNKKDSIISIYANSFKNKKTENEEDIIFTSEWERDEYYKNKKVSTN